MNSTVELKKLFGEVYLRARIIPGNAFLLAQWSGVLPVETVMQGGYKLIEMIQECGCNKLLNSNKDVIGSWDLAVDWVTNEYTPQVKAAGLQYLAQVVPTSIYATMSIESLFQKIGDEFEIRTFDDEADAEAWLRSI